MSNGNHVPTKGWIWPDGTSGSLATARPANMVAVPTDKLKQLQTDRDELLAALEKATQELALMDESSDVHVEETGQPYGPDVLAYRALIARIKAGK